MREERTLRKRLLVSGQQGEWERKEGQERQERTRERHETQGSRHQEERSLPQLQRDWPLCATLPEEERVKQCKFQRWRCALLDVHRRSVPVDYDAGTSWTGNDGEFLVDSGAPCHAWPCKTTAGSSYGETFLTATSAPVATQGTLEVKFQFCSSCYL